MRELVGRIYRKWKRDGFVDLCAVATEYLYLRHVRPSVLTHSRIVEYNGVESPGRVSVFDRIVPWYTPDDPEYEDAELAAIRSTARPGDTVVVVGAGFGITSTVAADAVGDEGRVVAYEASSEMVSHTRRTARHNGVSDRVDVRHAVVARCESARGETDSAPRVDPRDLPDCEYLEVDCEGAERQILAEASIEPRVISVETHEQYGVEHREIVELLTAKGYEIERLTDKDSAGLHHIVALRDE
jgi:hypothetical protein